MFNQQIKGCKQLTHRCKHICKPPEGNSQPHVYKRAFAYPTQEKLFFKLPIPSKKI